MDVKGKELETRSTEEAKIYPNLRRIYHKGNYIK